MCIQDWARAGSEPDTDKRLGSIWRGKKKERKEGKDIGKDREEMRTLFIFYALMGPFGEPKRLVFSMLLGGDMVSCPACHFIKLN